MDINIGTTLWKVNAQGLREPRIDSAVVEKTSPAFVWFSTPTGATGYRLRLDRHEAEQLSYTREDAIALYRHECEQAVVAANHRLRIAEALR